MTKRFDNFGDLTSSLAFDLIDALKGRRFGNFEASPEYGASNQSCSAYVHVWFMDDEGEGVEDFKVRFSDHADRYGSDITLRINHLVETIEDAGDYIATEISAENYATLINDAFAAIAERAQAL